MVYALNDSDVDVICHVRVAESLSYVATVKELSVIIKEDLHTQMHFLHNSLLYFDFS